MKQEEFEEQMSFLVNDFESVRDAIYDAMDDELFALFHVEHSVAFHSLLQDRVLQYFKTIVMEKADNG